MKSHKPNMRNAGYLKPNDLTDEQKAIIQAQIDRLRPKVEVLKAIGRKWLLGRNKNRGIRGND